MKWIAFALALATLTVGCASQPAREPPKRVAVPVAARDELRAPVRVEDARSERAKVNRLSPGNKPTTYLGDAVFTPGPVQIVNAHLDRDLPSAHRAAQIELTRFDVGLMAASSYAPAGATGDTVAGIPAGAAGYLVNALVAAIAADAAGYGAGAYADIAIRVDGVEFIGVEFVGLVGLTPEEALARAVSNAMHLLTQEMARRA